MGILIAATINAHIDPKRTAPVRVDDLTVFDKGEVRRKVQTPEQMAAMLRFAAKFMGSGNG